MKKTLPPLFPLDAWRMIAEIGWGVDVNLKAVQRSAFAMHGEFQMSRIEEFVRKRVNDLYKAVEKYEKEHESLHIGSDDGFSDVCHHVVGLGQTAFDAAYDNPRLLESRYNQGDYQESFAYCFQKPEPVKSDADKNRDFLLLIGQVHDLENLALVLHAKTAEVVRLARIVQNDRA